MKFIDKLSQKNKGSMNHSPATIAFLGDSITQGCFELLKDHTGKISTVFEQESAYHQKLKQLLAQVFPSVPINTINAGVSGNSAEQGLARLERDVFAYSPDLVVVCFGLNDSMGGGEKLDSYIQSLERIFREIKVRDLDLLFLTPNMMNTYVSPNILDKDMVEMARKSAEVQNTGMLDMYIEKAIQLCHNEQVDIVDCYGKWKRMHQAGADTTALLSNLINHPTRAMHDLFAYELFQKVMFH